MILDVFWKNVKNNEFSGRLIDIGLENVAVAVARVVGGDLCAAVLRGAKSVDVYKT